MAERRTPGGKSRASVDAPSNLDWSVDGGDGHGDGGLGDSVVRIPKITDDMVRPPSTGTGRAPSRTGTGRSGRTTAPSERSQRAGARDNTSTRGEQVKAPTGRPQTGAAPAVPPMAAAAVAAPAAKTQPIPATGTKPAPKPGARRTRKARLRVARVDPWSVMKTVFLFSVAFGIMGWVATYLLWQVILASGLFDALNNAIAEVMSSPSNTEGFRIEDYVSANKVLGVSALVAVINTVITTALGTLGAFLYNLSANILGGLELTLAED